MKIILTVLVIISSLNVNSQTKQDSIIQAQANKFIDSLVKKTSVADFMDFIGKNAVETKTKFSILDGFYTYFVRTKYEDWLNKKKN